MAWTFVFFVLALGNGVLAAIHAAHSSPWWAALAAFGAGMCLDAAIRNIAAPRR